MKETIIDPEIGRQLPRVRVNMPARMLADGWLERILAMGMQPEIGLDHQALDNLAPEYFRTVGRRLESAGLSASAHGPFLDLWPAALDPEALALARRRFAKALETAALFSARHIVFHPNYDRRRHLFYHDQWLAISLETWRPLAVRARELGIRLVLENTYEEHPDEMAPLLAGLAGDGVGFCFDCGHANAFGTAPVMDWLRGLAPHLAVMHLHDNDGGYDQHLALGSGSIDFDAIFRFLRDRNLTPAVTLEPHEEGDLAPSLVALARFWPEVSS